MKSDIGTRILAGELVAKNGLKIGVKLALAWQLLALLLCVFALSIAGCSLMPQSSEPARPAPQFCIVRKADHKCWFEQQAGKGIDLDNIEGFFAISPDDLDTLANRLSQCHEGGK